MLVIAKQDSSVAEQDWNNITTSDSETQTDTQSEVLEIYQKFLSSLNYLKVRKIQGFLPEKLCWANSSVSVEDV